jgi:hypothetical protein
LPQGEQKRQRELTGEHHMLQVLFSWCARLFSSQTVAAAPQTRTAALSVEQPTVQKSDDDNGYEIGRYPLEWY